MTVPVKVRSALTLLAALVALTAMMFVFQARPAQANEAVVSEARSWMGTAYRYPGMSYGVDCTEFTGAVFSQFGMSLPDYPSAQFGYGVPSDAGAGDLVFYSEGGYGITHAGIATGNGTVIHSSSYFGVVTETPMYDIPGYVGSVDVY
ncbi:MAG: NlpC/P60 family protein [Rubrobacteraceae bacterium]